MLIISAARRWLDTPREHAGTDFCRSCGAKEETMSSNATKPNLISADGHVIEPPNLFTDHIDREFLDRAPHVKLNEKGWVTYHIGEGITPLLPGVTGSTGRLGLAMDEARKMGYDALRPSGW